MRRSESLEVAAQQALYRVEDPELPISIVDLGMVRSVECDAASRSAKVQLVSTFTGCSAQMFIEEDVQRELQEVGFTRVSTTWQTMPAWTTDAVSPYGREVLRKVGVLVPDDLGLRCPHCASTKCELQAEVGASLCRSMAYCSGCMTPFEILRAPGQLQTKDVPVVIHLHRGDVKK